MAAMKYIGNITVSIRFYMIDGDNYQIVGSSKWY